MASNCRYVNPEEIALSGALEDAQGVRVQVTTVREIIAAVQFKGDGDLYSTLTDRKNARKIPQILDRIGYELIPNPNSKDGRWRLGGQQKETLYADKLLPKSQQLFLVNARCRESH